MACRSCAYTHFDIHLNVVRRWLDDLPGKTVMKNIHENARDRAEIEKLRLPPQSIEAEQSVIGSLLLDNDAWNKVGDLITDRDFYLDSHRRVYRHITVLMEKDKPADVVTVYESTEKSNEIDQTGGLAYLGEIANARPSAANARHHAGIIREKAILRSLIRICDDVAGKAIQFCRLGVGAHAGNYSGLKPR